MIVDVFSSERGYIRLERVGGAIGLLGKGKASM